MFLLLLVYRHSIIGVFFGCSCQWCTIKDGYHDLWINICHLCQDTCQLSCLLIMADAVVIGARMKIGIISVTGVSTLVDCQLSCLLIVADAVIIAPMVQE